MQQFKPLTPVSIENIVFVGNIHLLHINSKFIITKMIYMMYNYCISASKVVIFMRNRVLKKHESYLFHQIDISIDCKLNAVLF